MFLHTILRLLKWLWEQTDTLLALLLGLICSILGILGVVQISVLVSAALGTLTVLAFSLMRDRTEREKLQKRLDRAIDRFDDFDLDDFFKREPNESTILQEAEREIWMVQETAAYIIDSRKASLVSFLKRGGIIRIVVTMPKEEVIRWLAYRSRDFSYEAIKTRAQSFHHYIETIINEVGENAERLQVRYIPHVIDYLTVVTDPESSILKRRRAVIRYPGFFLPFQERLAMNIEADKTPMLFNHFHQEVQRLFAYATKIVVIVGPPYSDGISVITKLISSVGLEDHRHIFSVISHPILKGSKIIGYEVQTSTDTATKTLAKTHSSSGYDVDEQIMNEIALALETAYNDRKIVLIDGFMPLYLSNSHFAESFEKILSDPTISLFITLNTDLDNKSVSLQRKLLFHYRSTVIRLKDGLNDRAEIEKNLRQEMETSIYTTKHLKHLSRLKKSGA